MSQSRTVSTLPRLLAVAAARGFGLGILVAVLLGSAAFVVTSFEWQTAIVDLMIVVWPTSFWLMALEGARSSWDATVIYGAALGGNGLLYAVVCCVVRLVLWIVRDR